jgi:hypothetical protein
MSLSSLCEEVMQDDRRRADLASVAAEGPDRERRVMVLPDLRAGGHVHSLAV